MNILGKEEKDIHTVSQGKEGFETIIKGKKLENKDILDKRE